MHPRHLLTPDPAARYQAAEAGPGSPVVDRWQIQNSPVAHYWRSGNRTVAERWRTAATPSSASRRPA